MNPRKKYAIGIGVNFLAAQAFIVSVEGKIVARIEKHKGEITAQRTIEVLLELAHQIYKKYSKYQQDICGIGIALGGIVDRTKGIVYWPERKRDSYVYLSIPLKRHIEKEFNLPVYIENDATASVWAEYKINFPRMNSLLYMFSGVGAGMVINRRLYRGRNGAAGELFVKRNKHMESVLGDYKFLSQWPLDLNIVKHAKELIASGRKTRLIKKLSPVGDLSLKDVYEEAKKDDSVAKEVLQAAAHALGIKIAFLVNFLNPQGVIIGGSFSDAGHCFFSELERVIKENSFTEMKNELIISLSKLGKEAPSLGAGLIVFDENSLLEE